MTPMNHETFHGNRSARFSEIRNTDTQTDRRGNYSYGEGQNWGYQNSKTPEPIVTKFGMGDYVGDMAQQAKIQTDRPSGSVPANG